MSQLEQLRTRLIEMHHRLSGGEDSGESEANLPLDERLAVLRRRVRKQATRLVSRTAPPPTAPLVGLAARLHDSFQSHRTQLRRLGTLVPDELEPAQRLADLAIDLLSQHNAVAKQLELLPALEEIDKRLQQIVAEHRHKQEQSLRSASLISRIYQLHQDILTARPVEQSELTELATALTSELDYTTFVFENEASFAPEQAVACHSLNVACIVALTTAQDVRWRAFREQMIIAALTMDAGDATAAELSEEDIVTVQCPENHPLVAEAFLEGRLEAQFAQAAAAHHEQLDGGGVPRGLTGEELSPPARMLACVDRYCTLRRRTPKSPPMNAREALLTVLREAEEGKWDPVCARQMLNLGLYPVGSVVELSTGELAQVVATQEATQAPHLASLPIVRLLTTPDKARKDVPVLCNLAQWPDSRIVRVVSAMEAAEVTAE